MIEEETGRAEAGSAVPKNVRKMAPRSKAAAKMDETFPPVRRLPSTAIAITSTITRDSLGDADSMEIH
jgi:uncharacterized protein (UPF0147 family)